MRLRVPVDYNSEEENGEIYINTVVHPELLKVLKPGLELTLYDSESLEVDAVATFDETHKMWFGVPDWTTRRDLPGRVRVDFNSEDENGRISINTVVQPYLLSLLKPGLPITLYDSESLEVDATVEFDEGHQHWYGIPDWSTRRHMPPLDE